MPTTASRPQPLDPRTLGRPVHLLPRFAQQLGLGLAELFRPYNRRHRAQYQLGEISIKPLLARTDAEVATERWLSGAGPVGPLACLLPRPLLLSLMAHRYGAPDGVEATESPAETATEERLQRLLAQQLLGLVMQQAGLGTAELPPPLQAGPLPALAAGAWLLRVPVREAGQALDGELLIALDGAYIDPLLKRLAEQGQPRTQNAAQAAPPATALPRRLQLKLAARLLEQTLPLGELLDLKPGDLVPVRLGSTQVLVDGSPLFSASVAEHQGKLCLTSFADLE